MIRAGAIGVAALLCVSCAGDDGGDDGVAGSSGGTAATSSGATPDDGVDDGVGPSSSDGAAGSTAAETGPDPDSTGGDTGTGTTGGAVEPGPVVVYVMDGESSLQLWSVDDDAGTLTMQTSYDTGPGAAQLGLHPDGLHLYATARGGGAGNRVIAYEINPADGTLTELGVTSIEIGPVYWSIDPSGDFAFSASFGGDEIGVWAINDDFTVANGAIEVEDAGDEPHAIVPYPTGGWVYVPHRGTNDIRQYEVDSVSGMLSQVDVVAAAVGAGARHLAFDPAGEHAYLADEFSDTVTHFSVDTASGALTIMETLPTIPPEFDGGNNTCADVHVTPDGSAVYVSNRGHDSLAMFSVDATTGALTSMGQIATEATPREFDIDPTGRFVYSAGQGTGGMAGYTIDAGGTLTAGATVNIGGTPSWVLGVELPAP
ncbi:MAG: beta-propeller fold lactonase family protein [Myxococcota bacterium]